MMAAKDKNISIDLKSWLANFNNSDLLSINRLLFVQHENYYVIEN